MINMNKLLQTIISIFKKSYDSLSEQTSPQTTAVKSSTKQNEESEPPVKAAVIEEYIVKESTETQAKAEPAKESVVKTPTIHVSKTTTDNLPQDSIQRRHTLSQLHNFIESIKGPRPSDSIQSRHYDALVYSQITQALTDKVALENIYKGYESLNKTVAQALIKPTSNIQEIAVEIEEPPVTPTTHLKTETKSVISLPPTDSILRRHYDTIINNELNRLLVEK